MPVAQQQLTFIVEKQEEPVINIPELDFTIIKEIQTLRDRIERAKKEKQEYKRKNQKYDKAIEQAKELLAKAEEKEQQLLARKEALQNVFDAKTQKVKDALLYWKNYGFDDETFIAAPHEYVIGVKYHEDKLSITHCADIFNEETLTNLNSLLNSRCVSGGLVDYKLAMLTIKKELYKAIDSKTS